MQTPFVKRWADAPPGFFAWEAAGLSWLAEAAGGPSVAEVIAVQDDRIEERHVGHARCTAEAARSFGARLAAMHAAGADAWGAPPAGWTGDGFIGRRPMACQPSDAWGRFYASQRVLPFLDEAECAGSVGVAQARLVRRACAVIADGAFDTAAEEPCRLHGDLWNGNVLWGHRGAVLIDPAAHGGHRETDLAMLALFGAPHLDEIVSGYQSVRTLAPGWRERVPLHQLHPLAVHATGHGPGYAEPLVSAARWVLDGAGDSSR